MPLSLNSDPPISLPTKQLAKLGLHLGDIAFRSSKWNWKRFIRQTDTLQLMQTNMNGLAIIVTFLAAVQAQAISFTLDKNTTALQRACNVLFFAGLFVDVLSGSIAIVGAVQLQRAQTLLQQRESSLTDLSDAMERLAQSPSPGQQKQDSLAIIHHLRFLKMVIFPFLHSPRLWTTLSLPLKESADALDDILRHSELDDSHRISATYAIADYRHTTNGLAKSTLGTSLGFTASLTVPWLVLTGLCCFTAGAVCLVLDSQPVEVWATSFAVLGGIVLLLIAFLGFIVGRGFPTGTLPFHDV